MKEKPILFSSEMVRIELIKELVDDNKKLKERIEKLVEEKKSICEIYTKDINALKQAIQEQHLINPTRNRLNIDWDGPLITD